MTMALITDELITEVLRQYPVPNPHVVALIEASKRNDNVLVEDAAGRRYVLRRYRRNPGARRIIFQLRFQQELHRLGFPTSEIIEAAAGGLFVTSDVGPWVLFTYIDGTEYDFSRMEQVVEAGRRLAEFHVITQSIDLEEVLLDINYDLRRWWTHGDDELAGLERLFSSQGVDDEIAFLRAWQADLVLKWPLARLEALPTGWLHSDFHGRNMVFVDDELRGLFDFDPLHREFLIEDVGHAIFMFSREFRGSTHIRPEAAQLFLDAYRGVRPLEEDEWAALPMVAVLAWAPSAPYHELLLRDGEDSLAFFRHYVQLMRDLGAEMERLMPLLH